jgi:hypothetical protein
MKTILTAVAAIPFLVVASVAFAGQPVVLSDGQMDKVTAGFAATASAAADALGWVTATSAQTLTVVKVIGTAPRESGGLDLVSSTSVAASAASALGHLPPIPIPTT